MLIFINYVFCLYNDVANLPQNTSSLSLSLASSQLYSEKYNISRSGSVKKAHSIMVKIGRNPGRLVVAILASDREPSRGVVRVIGLRIFRLVTTVTGARYIVVIVVDVAGVTIE